VYEARPFFNEKSRLLAVVRGTILSNWRRRIPLTTVIWIDWYSYHVARFRALFEHESFKRQVTGIELVGGYGVHAGLQFRDAERAGLPISSLFPQADWNQTGQMTLAWAVWAKLNQMRPSSVLVPGWYTAPALAAAVWARLHGKRSILMSETTEQDHRRVWWKECSKRLLIRLLFDFGVAGGKPHVRYLAQLGLPLHRIARFYDVVDNLFYQEETERARQSPELRQICGLPKSYFLYVGRLAPEKNVSASLRAFARYRELGGTWSFVLVGDGPEREALEKQSHELGLSEHVVFAGLKAAKETTIYYAFAGCFVLPSIREPWGLVVNEAMASGLPLIVSNRCGCTEDLVESGGNGYLFDPTNDAELADHMLMVSASSQAVLDAMRQRSREIIADYSPEHWAAEVARVVQEGRMIPLPCEF
jgi:1,2-diacylglycerol 3-alpha-glucosyltransferase